MSDDPERLLGGGSDFERTLLRSAIDEEPSSRSMRKAAVALAAATGAGTFTKTLWAARDLAHPLTTGAGKVVAGTVLLGSAAYLVATQSSLPPAPDDAFDNVSVPTAAPIPRGADDGIDEDTATGEAIVQLDELQPEEDHRPAEGHRPADALDSPTSPRSAIAPTRIDVRKLESAPSSATESKTTESKTTPQAERSTIADEIAALDAARRTLDAGNATGALARLDAYAKQFPRGRLGQEAMVVRIRALIGSGQHQRAEALASAFKKNNPQSPYNKRIDSIVTGGAGR